MRTVFFAINFSGALLLIASSIAAIDGSETQVSGLCLLPTATLFAAAEWINWHRRRRDVERVLGVVCLGLAALALLAVLSAVVETTHAHWRAELASGLLLLSGVGVYLGLCGFRRWRGEP